MKSIRVKFEHEKETKNTVRFSEVISETDAAVIGTLYVQKAALKELGLKEGVGITVTLEVSE